MGACCGCCGDKEPYDPFTSGVGGGSSAPVTQAPQTEQDRAARALAAERASARQNNFEASAAGRAAYTSVRDVKEQRRAPPTTSKNEPDARDWMN